MKTLIFIASFFALLVASVFMVNITYTDYPTPERASQVDNTFGSVSYIVIK